MGRTDENTWRVWAPVGLFFLAGLVLRLLMLREPAWGDEMSTIWIIGGNDLFGVISMVDSDAEISPPFYFLLAEAGSWVFGQTPDGVRVPSLIAGVLIIPAFYLVGLKAIGQRAALYAAAIACVSPFLVYFSANARSYSVMLLMLVLASWFLLTATSGRGRTRHWVGWAIFGALAVYSHYVAGLALVGQLIWALWFFPTLRLRTLAFSALMALLFLPWLGGFINDLDSPTSNILEAIQGKGFEARLTAIKDLLFLWIGSDKPGLFGRPDMLLGLAGVIVASVAVIRNRISGRSQKPSPERIRGVCLAALMVFAVIGLELMLLVAGTDIFGARNLAPAWAGLPLLIAAGVAAAGPRWGALALVLIVAGFSVTTVRLLDPARSTVPYEKAAEAIESDEEAGGAVIDNSIISPAPLSPLDAYLEGDLPVFAMTGLEDRPDFIRHINRTFDPQEIADRAFATGGPVRVVTIGDAHAPRETGQGITFSTGPGPVRVPDGWRESDQVRFEGVEPLTVTTFTRQEKTGQSGNHGSNDDD